MCKIADWIPAVFLIMCSVVDWRKKEIPVWMLLLFGAAVTGLLVCYAGEGYKARIVGGGIGILMLIISKVTKEAVGYGDSILMFLLGCYVGGYRLLQILFTASFLAGGCSLFLLWKKGFKKTATLPFVPFLAVAYVGGMWL